MSLEYQKQYCTFKLNNLTFGIEVLKVQEVMMQPSVTAIPLASDIVRGLMNLRGQIVPTIDLRERLDMPPPDGDVHPMSVVLATSDGPISLMVDEIGDVVDVDARMYEETPPTVCGSARELISGVYKLPTSLLLILDVAKVVDIESVVLAV